MIDPLQNFNWQNLYVYYDELCEGFNSHHRYLNCFKNRPRSDRELYYYLIEKFSEDRKNFGKIKLETYKAMLYWVFYARGYARVIIEIDNHFEVESKLEKISKKLPKNINKDIEDITRLLQLDEFSIFGMASSDSFPVRTTFLHFIYPEVIPIFDRMVLQAVGINNKNASHSINTLKEYIPFAWYLADKYKEEYKKYNFKETEVRLIDMALWVNRGQ